MLASTSLAFNAEQREGSSLPLLVVAVASRCGHSSSVALLGNSSLFSLFTFSLSLLHLSTLFPTFCQCCQPPFCYLLLSSCFFSAHLWQRSSLSLFLLCRVLFFASLCFYFVLPLFSILMFASLFSLFTIYLN